MTPSATVVAQGWSFELKIESTTDYSGGVELGFVAAAPDTLSLPLPIVITSLTLASKAPLGAWCLGGHGSWKCFGGCTPEALPAGTRIRVMLHFDARVSVWVDGKRMGPAPALDKEAWSSASLLKPGSTQLWGVVGVYGKHESISLIPDAGVAVQASSPTPHASPSAESEAGEESLKKTAAAVPGQGMAAAAPSACAAAVGFHQTVMGANARIAEDTLLAYRMYRTKGVDGAVVLTAAPVAYHTEEKVRQPARTVRYCQLTPCPRCHNNTDALRVFVCLAMG